MKKILCLLFTMATIIAACDKAFINGDLDGMWQLRSVESSDTTIYPTDIYYSFQRHMVQISEHYETGLPLRYIGNLRYTGDTVAVDGFRKFLEEEKVATTEILKKFHLHGDTTVFIIEKLNDEQLLMNSNGRRYILQRW